jgi:hypothetical protein
MFQLRVGLITLTKNANCVTHQYLVSSILLTLFSDKTNLSQEPSSPHAAHQNKEHATCKYWPVQMLGLEEVFKYLYISIPTICDEFLWESFLQRRIFDSWCNPVVVYCYILLRFFTQQLVLLNCSRQRLRCYVELSTTLKRAILGNASVHLLALQINCASVCNRIEVFLVSVASWRNIPVGPARSFQFKIKRLICSEHSGCALWCRKYDLFILWASLLKTHSRNTLIAHKNVALRC